MRSRRLTLCAVAVFGLLVIQIAHGQQHGQWKGCGPAYDPGTETTLQGTIVGLTEHPCACGMTGMHATFESADGTMEIHLAPASYLKEVDLRLQPGNLVEITGSRVEDDGEEVLIARQVVRDEVTLTLRDEEGLPRWACGRGRGRDKETR